MIKCRVPSTLGHANDQVHRRVEHLKLLQVLLNVELDSHDGDLRLNPFERIHEAHERPDEGQEVRGVASDENNLFALGHKRSVYGKDVVNAEKLKDSVEIHRAHMRQLSVVGDVQRNDVIPLLDGLLLRLNSLLLL